MKRFWFQFGFAMFLMGSLVGMLSVRSILVERAEKQFEVVPLIVFDLTYPIAFGILFALPFLWLRYQQNRIKGFMWPEFLGIGLPSLFIAVSHWLFYTNFPMNPVTEFFAKHDPNGPMLFGFIFGFSMIHSIRQGPDQE